VDTVQNIGAEADRSAEAARIPAAKTTIRVRME
jgi:hypothetical protein